MGELVSREGAYSPQWVRPHEIIGNETDASRSPRPPQGGEETQRRRRVSASDERACRWNIKAPEHA